jgi:integrase
VKRDEILPKSTKIYTKRSNPVAITHLNFTKAKLNALPSPATGHVYYHDAGGALSVRGLAVRVSFTGNKVFTLYRRIGGRPERVVLGPFPDMTIEQARGKASELNALIAKGQNPVTQKKQIRDEMTLLELFKQYGDLHGKQKRTWGEMQREFGLYLKPWQFRRISSITTLNVLALKNSLAQTPYAANHAIRLLRALYNWATKSGGWQGQNPAAVPLFPEEKRQRFLLPEEVSAFFSAVDAEQNETIRDFIYVSLLTGGRRGNVQAMSWSQLNLNLKLWTIPGDLTKGGETITIPLLPPVLEILERRKKAATSEWVFPSRGRTGYLVEPKSAWKRIVKAAGLSDLRLHDLRRTLASWQAIMGSSLLVIQKSLGHQSPAATQIYARLSNAAVKESMERAANALLLAGTVQEDKT